MTFSHLLFSVYPSYYMSTSALYVVDLKKFRKIAAGDRLRGQYQALSQDPNSLSNLDQVSFLSAPTTLKACVVFTAPE